MKRLLIACVLAIAVYPLTADTRPTTLRSVVTINGGEATVTISRPGKSAVTLRARVDDAGEILVPDQDGLTDERGDVVRSLIREAITK